MREIVEGEIGALTPPDTAKREGDVFTWSEAQGVETFKVTQNGTMWINRQMTSFVNGERPKQVYVIKDVRFEPHADLGVDVTHFAHKNFLGHRKPLSSEKPVSKIF